MSLRWLTGLVLVPLAVSACGDSGDAVRGDESLVGLEAAMMVAGCNTRDLSKAARDYFSRPEEGIARNVVKDLDAACQNGDAPSTTALVFDLLEVVEGALAAGTQGSAADGNVLVTEALAFATFDCVTSGACAPVAGDFTEALSVGGAFQVVDDGTGPVISRGLPVGETWVVEPGPAGNWQAVLGQRSLIYGFPTGGFPVNETPLPVTQYEWEVIPDALGGFGAQPVVGVCHDPVNATGIPTVQRNTTLLEPAAVAACVTVTASLSPTLLDRMLKLADRWVGAQPLYASAQSGRGTGGRPTDFSTFVAVDAVVTGRLIFVTQPAPVNTAGQPIGGPVQVRAVTDQGTPLEHVLIALSAEVNNGATVQITNNQAFTEEGGGIATFPNVSINKPGGYVLCAEAIQTDGVGGTSYSIAGACSNPLHIRNN